MTDLGFDEVQRVVTLVKTSNGAMDRLGNPMERKAASQKHSE